MKYLSTYELFEKVESKEKIKEKIKKFFPVDYIIDKAIELHPKLAVWIINQLINKTKEEYGKNLNKMSYTSTWNPDFISKITSIVDWSKSKDISLEDRKNLTKMTFEEAYQKSEDWHNSLIAGGAIENETGTVIIEFDDGFYWIDLETTYCEDEADAMGHCGRTNKGDTLLSLRDRKKQPHITVAIDDDGVIYQMKGRNNKKPISKYHEYIVDLLLTKKITIKGFSSEYNPWDDFSINDLNKELKSKLLKEKPDIQNKIYTEEEIDNDFSNYLESSYGDSDSNVFDLMNWAFELLKNNKASDEEAWNEIESMITSYGKSLDKLTLILKKQNLIEIDRKDYINTFSTYLDANIIADEYNITINKKDSNSNKWETLDKHLSDDQLNKILNKYDLGENLILDKTHYYESRDILIKYLSKFPYDDRIAEMEKIFDYDLLNKYDISMYELISYTDAFDHIERLLDKEEKEDILFQNGYLYDDY